MTMQQASPQVTIDNAKVQAFKAKLRGQVLTPVDEEYDAARSIWNSLIDRRPALIARCADAGDVVASVQFARELGLDVAIRGGGHGVAGYAVCDGGLMIDLSPMQGLEIDPDRRIARVEAGLSWGTLDRETQKHGLATTGGIIPTTGIAGLTLGGGLGYLMRSCGLACDNVLSAEVVTADGQQIRASADENADLFWGLRGGGGNFGIVTRFEFQLHPVGPTVLGGLILHPIERAREATRVYREFNKTAPDELIVHISFATSPEGHPLVVFIVCYNGPIEEGEQVIKPLREFGPPLADMVAPIPYTEMQARAEPLFPYGRLHYWKSSFVRELSDEAIETAIAQFATVPSPLSGVTFEQLGGAMSRVGPNETAFGDRSAPYSLIITSQWEDRADSDQNIQWARDCWDAMQPFSKDEVYINYIDQGDEARVKDAFTASSYDRLVALKNTYDRTNFLHLNQNIAPEE
jgi:UDP-N-acetylenolpyruvoylglucosamine reductase